MAGAAATGAGNRGTFAKRRAQPLAAHFHQAEFADGAKLHSCTVLAQGVAQAVFHFAAVFALFHVNEIDHDQAAQVAQAHLAGYLVGSFEVGAGGGFFDVAAFDGAGGVHVHAHQRFGVVNHDGAAGWQRDGAGIGRFNLVLNLKAAEQRRVVAVALHAGGMLGHDVRHELLRLVEHVVGVDQDVANVGIEVIANGANHQAGFLVNQESAFTRFGGAVNGGPKLEQVIQVPLQLGGRAPNASGSGNDGHAAGVFQLV